VNALLTDLYELNMAASYLRRGMTGTATFSLFVRSLPAARGFLVAAGIESCLDRLQNFRFEEDDIRYLRDTLRYEPRDLEAFRRLGFTGDIWAIPEGRVALAGEPILEVTAPLPEAQLIETMFLNLITFETTIASKAARCVLAGGGIDVIDFSFRRTQGIEAGIDVARLSSMVGFISTSNVEAASRFGLIAAGTMAHSYIEAFPTEVDAFRAYTQDFPGRVTFLVDTYDTITGITHAIATIKELGPTGRLGIRIDSGDMVALSKQARKMLDQAGLPHVRIVASGGLDEFSIDQLVRDGAKVDAFGVGTRMGVSADHPYLDTAYKLVCYEGRAVMKLSSGKVTAPGRKQVFRRSRPFGDLVGLHDEELPPGRERLLEPVMIKGARRAARSPIAEAKARFAADVACLPVSAKDSRSPRPPFARHTPALRAVTSETHRRLVAGLKGR